MLVKPLKFAAGRFNFRPDGPAFEVNDADAKELIADGAVVSLEPEKPRQQEAPKRSEKQPHKKA